MINDKLYLHVTEGYVIMQVTKGGSLCHVVKNQCCMVTLAQGKHNAQRYTYVPLKMVDAMEGLPAPAAFLTSLRIWSRRIWRIIGIGTKLPITKEERRQLRASEHMFWCPLLTDIS